MSISNCPNCGRMCFSDDAGCPGCSYVFPPGELKAKAIADETVFMRKSNAVFAVVFFALMVALAFAVLRPTV